MPFKSIGSILIIYFLSSSALAQGLNTAFMTEAQRLAYQQGLAEGQAANVNCEAVVGAAISNSFGTSYDAYSRYRETQMENAQRAAEAAQGCRNNILQHWQTYRQQELENRTQRNQLSLKIRQAELEYDRELIQLRKQCQVQAREEYQTYKDRVTGNGVINDPTRGPGFQESINQYYQTAFNQCFRGDIVTREELKRMRAVLANQIDLINAEMQASNEALNYLRQDLQTLQREEIEKCEENREINNYFTDTTEEITRRGRDLAKIRNAIDVYVAINSCGAPGVRSPANNNSNGSPTAPDVTTGSTPSYNNF